jgi:hypothetical protein
LPKSNHEKTAVGGRGSHRHTALRVGSACCVVLVPIQLGLVPFLEYAWAFNLWQYLPGAAAAALAATLLALCWSLPRHLLVRGVRAVDARVRHAAVPVSWIFFAALPFLFWLLREREFHGDARLLMYNAAVGSDFIFPDVGATFLLRLSNRLSQGLGVPNLDYSVTQAVLCVFAAVAVACFWHLCRHLAPNAGRAAIACALIFCGGLLRVLCGHVEVYAFLLACAGAYLWAALAFLEGRCGYLVPSLALGIGCWMHLSFIFLIPSLVVLPILANPRHRAGDHLRAWSGGLVAGAAPYVVFFAAMWMLGKQTAIEEAIAKMLDWVGIVPAPEHFEALLRLWWKPAGEGTRYVIYSLPHLKFLANAFFLLVPTAIPLLIAFAIFSPRRFVATPQAVFLATGCLSLLVYSSLVRPYWGPHDWDIFSLTAVCFASLAAYLFVNAIEEPPFAQLGALLVAASLLMVSIPLVWIGISPAHAAGPFDIDIPAPEEDETLTEAFERTLGPWL